MDFHNDKDDARFCIRVQSTTEPDTIKEVFTVDNANVGIGCSTPFATLTNGTPIIASGVSNGTLVIAKDNGSGKSNFKLGFDDTFNFCMGIFLMLSVVIRGLQHNFQLIIVMVMLVLA